MNKIRFYLTFFIAKMTQMLLKLLKRNATYFPGKIGVTLCPNFLQHIQKPKKIICVTGTNGKTTVCNMINDVLKDQHIPVLNNHLGSNINSGIASSLIEGCNWFGKTKYDLAVFEIDERSSKKIYPYIKPDYIVCTNLFRDSIQRNAHTDFIAGILNEAIPSTTKMILNGDDLISGNLVPKNERVYFGINQLETDTKEPRNIVRDILVCPKCQTKLEYEYVRYHHIGKAHCPKCDFGSPKIDYFVTNLQIEEKKMDIQVKDHTETYTLISNNIINIYNMLAMITVLREYGLTQEQLEASIQKLQVVETRFSKQEIGGIQVIMHLAKGQNPIACSRVFDYVKNEKGSKAVILLLDDLHEAVHSSENITWLYDTDFEFLQDDSIKQIIVAGARYLDDKVRLFMAGVKEETMICMRDEMKTVDALELEGIDQIFILHDLYAFDLAQKVKKQVEEKIQNQRKSDQKEEKEA